jgi:ADP-ribosylglycohydrolase
MIGAIAGDIIGSVHEFNNIKTEDFPLFSPKSIFTDDTVMTIAVADCILTGKGYAAAFKEWGRLFPYSGYGGMFSRWLISDDSKPYNSFGNGSAMRVSPVGFAFDSLDKVLEEAGKSAESPTITLRASKVPRPWRPPSFWPGQAKVKRK